MPASDRVVVVMKSFLGDAVMALPLLDALRDRFETHVVAPPVIGHLLGPTWAAQFTGLSQKGFGTYVAAIGKGGPGTAVLVNRSFRAALGAFCARVPHRLGYATEGRGFLLTQRLTQDWERHETESYLALAAPLGIQGIDPTPRLDISEDRRAKGKTLLSGATWIVQPGASHDEKRLSTGSICQLIERLSSEGKPAALIGGPDEQAAAQSVIDGLQCEVVNLVGKCPLPETLGVVAAAEFAIGGDTGVMHLAAAVGTPTVTAFGPSQPAARWGHLYAPHRILQAGPAGVQAVTSDELFEQIEAIFDSQPA